MLSLLFALLASTPASPGADLCAALVEALNSKDEAKLRAFVEARAAKDVAVETRVARLKALAERGAPFKLVRIVSEKPGSVRGLFENKAAEPLGFVLELSGDEPPRLARLQLGPPDLADPKPARDYSFTNLEQLAAQLIKDFESPAMALALVRDGKLEEVAVGVREIGQPAAVKTDDRWSVGSIGKPLCSSVIGKLIEGGRLRWDTTLAEALPEVPMRAGYRTVTLEQIMKHRGGIPEDGGFTRQRVDAIAGDARTPEEIRARYVADVLAREPIARPGTTFAYSNAGYALLSHIAERTAKEPYEKLVQEMVFKPLGLAHSSIGDRSAADAGPSGHVQQPDGSLRPVLMRGPLEKMLAGAGGGVWMSAGDLARFGQAHLEGLGGKDGFLKAATIQRLHRGEPEGGPGGGSYACGWGIHEVPGLEPFQGHNGSNGTFRAELAIFPKAKVVVVGIVNRGGEGQPSPGLAAVVAVGRKLAQR